MDHAYQDEEVKKLARDITGLIETRGVSNIVIFVYSDLSRRLNGSKSKLDTYISLFSKDAGLDEKITLNELKQGCEELERQKFLRDKLGKAVERDITRCFERFEKRAAAAC